MESVTICMHCNHRVPVGSGFCCVCGEVFVDSTIKRQVAAEETQNDIELANYVRALRRLQERADRRNLETYQRAA